MAYVHTELEAEEEYVVVAGERAVAVVGVPTMIGSEYKF